MSYQLSLIEPVYLFPDHHSDHYESRNAQHPADPSAVKVEITTECFPGALLFAAAEATLVTRQPVSVGLRGRWTVAVVAATRGIDDRADSATLILIHPIGMAPIGH
jgi:hypothetical protein